MVAKLKSGTRISIRGFDAQNREVWEAGRIGRWHRSYRDPASRPAGYYPVTFDADEAKSLLHESSFRIVDNR